MGKTLGYVGVALVGTLLLSGCSGPEEEVAQTQPHSVAEERASEPEPPAQQVEPLDVAISTSASLRADRRLMVEGNTNLPDNAQVQVIIERELSRVRWQARTSVVNGQFEAGPFGSGSGLPDGGYVVTVQLGEATVQPLSVQARIGTQGEHLAGELVSQSRHGLGQVATYSRRFLVGSEPRRTRDQVDVIEDN
ncbi:hypothetical protein [Vreelandella lutescens]|uniref:Uncharacterized protein n=1 Tax=Vreelandella lutescens TaxID=1602943 RepID=A0ABQ1NJC4_9GAMM|nr:hypothetical protein [Halomonas lutescens]GGC78650.1 hypothetical protein GCM10011382_05820 [Halomonas lutescens]